MLQQIDRERDEARLLARVYALILSWNEPDAQPEPRERDERETKASNDDDEK